MGIRKQRPRDRDAGSTDLVDQRTGWQLVDALLTFALSPERERLSLLIDATPAGTLLVTPQRLVAANASCTVELCFRAHFVARESLVASSLAPGVARR